MEHSQQSNIQTQKIQQLFEYGERLAKEVNAEVIIATDPDCDRLAVEVIHNGEVVSLNGNQAGAVLVQYVIENLAKQNKFT